MQTYLSMSEAELEAEVIGLLEARPSLSWHLCRDSRRYPDLSVTGRRFALAELKGSQTRTRRHQLRYGGKLVAAGITWWLWNPDDLASGRIGRDLDSLI
jgi:hypothetical protein